MSAYTLKRVILLVLTALIMVPFTIASGFNPLGSEFWSQRIWTLPVSTWITILSLGLLALLVAVIAKIVARAEFKNEKKDR